MAEGTEATAGAETPVDVTTTATETTEAPVTETAKEETTAETVEKTEPAEETEDRPKRESGYSRMKRRALLAEAQLANARLSQATGTKADDKDDKAPREEDFNGDWGKYIAASAAHEAAKAVKGSLADDRRSAQEARAAELNQQVLDEFQERTEAFKAKATDFDDVVSGFVSSGGKFSDAVRDLVMDSDVGPQLTYYLAKNPVVANKLNGLTPLHAAKEIARIEDTLSKPSTKTTQAPPPTKPLNGGSGPAIDPRTGPDDMAAFATWLNKSLEGRRARR